MNPIMETRYDLKFDGRCCFNCVVKCKEATLRSKTWLICTTRPRGRSLQNRTPIYFSGLPFDTDFVVPIRGCVRYHSSAVWFLPFCGIETWTLVTVTPVAGLGIPGVAPPHYQITSRNRRHVSGCFANHRQPCMWKVR